MKKIATIRNSELHKILIAIIFWYGVISVNAQYQKPEISMPSPNAASLGIYGEIPISHFTGVPNINIPIYTLKNADIAIPINMSYHASGVQLDQRPGWVGLNWTLNAGGVITRTIKDLPDDYSNPYKTIKRYHLIENAEQWEFLNIITLATDQGIKGYNAGYYFNHKINAPINWADKTRIINLAKSLEDGRDTEPDKFSFNFLGYSGEFFLGEDGQWKVRSDDNIKVEVNTENEFLDLPTKLQCSNNKRVHVYAYNGNYNIKTFGGFTIITDDGTRYVFGNTTNAIEYSIPFFYQYGQEWSATSWYLTKIISPTQNEITLTYEPDSFISNMYISFVFDNTILWHDKSKKTVQCGLYGNTYSFPGGAAWGSAAPYWKTEFGSDTEHSADWINPRYDSYLGNLIRPVYLSKIETNDTEITFTRSTSTELNYNSKIYLKNRFLYDLVRSKTPMIRYWPVKNGELEERWPYLYEDVKSNDAKTLLTALNWKKLNTIQIKSKFISNQEFKFTLTYNDNSSQRLMLKSIKQSTLDNSSNLPGYSFKYYDDIVLPGYLSEATDHWGFNNGNMQKNLTQPRTQGFHDNLTTIINNYNATRNPTNNLNVAQAGSLKEIIYPTGGKTQFLYEQNKYVNCINDNRNGLMPDDGTTKKTGGIRIWKIINSTGITEETVTKEYLYVKNYKNTSNVETLSGSGILGGRISYSWYSSEKDLDDKIDEIEKYIFSCQSLLPMSSNSRGSHIGYSEVVEKLNNDSYTIFKYSNFSSEDGDHFDEPALPGSWSEASPFNPYSDKSFERGRLINQKIYENDGQPVKETSIKYKKLGANPNDFYGRGLLLIANQHQCAYGDMFLSYVGFPYKNYYYKYKIDSESITWYNNIGNLIENKTYTYNTKNLIKSTLVTNSNNKTFEQTTKYPSDFNFNYYWGSSHPLTNMVYRNMLNYPIEQKTFVDGKLTQYQFNAYSDDRENYRAYTNDVDRYKWIQPFHTYTLNTNLPINDFNGVTSGDGNTAYTIDPRLSKVATYTYYTDGNIKEIINPKTGETTVYLWSYSKQYPIAKIENATYVMLCGPLSTVWNNLQNASNPSKDEIEQVRLAHTYFSGAMMQITTYSYIPLIGISTMTDPRGVTTYYKYDDYNRLENIKDNNGSVLQQYKYHYSNQK